MHHANGVVREAVSPPRGPAAEVPPPPPTATSCLLSSLASIHRVFRVATSPPSVKTASAPVRSELASAAATAASSDALRVVPYEATSGWS